MGKKVKYDDAQLFEMTLLGLSWWESHLSEIIQTMVKGVDISFEQFMILYRLDQAKQHRVSVKELAADRHVSSSAISRKLTYLINHDLLTLEIDSEDRRYRYLTLTADGQSVVTLIKQVNEGRLDKFLNQFGRIRTSELADELKMVGKVLMNTKELEL